MLCPFFIRIAGNGVAVRPGKHSLHALQQNLLFLEISVYPPKLLEQQSGELLELDLLEYQYLGKHHQQAPLLQPACRCQ